VPHIAAVEAVEGTMIRVTIRRVGFAPCLSASLTRFGARAVRGSATGVWSGTARLVGLAVENLEAHQVQVDGMSIIGGIIRVQISVEPRNGFSVMGAFQWVASEAALPDCPTC